MNLARTPLAVAGFTLLVLGIGNWVTGVDKGAEYAELLRASRPAASEPTEHDFTALDAQANAMLLATLNRGRDPLTFVRTKMDFYEVVRSGGRLLVLAGVCLLAAALIQARHRKRVVVQATTPTSPG
jgi:hypothetical protein